MRPHFPISTRPIFTRRHRTRIAAFGASVLAIALLNLPAGAQTITANSNGDANYQVTIYNNLASAAIGTAITWTVTFNHTTVPTGTTAGQIDTAASLAVIVPNTLSNVTWQCSASAGSYCNSRPGQAQSVSMSGTGSARILPGLALTGAQLTVTVIGTPTQIGVARVSANKHNGDGALNDQAFGFGAYADATAVAAGGSTTSTSSTLGSGSTTSTLAGATSTVFSAPSTTLAVTTSTNPGPCYVSGFIWFDADGDGAAGAEPGIGGMRVAILTTNPPWSDTNGDGLPRAGEPGVLTEAVTDSSGTFVTTVLGCNQTVRAFFGPLKNTDGAPLVLTKQWLVNGVGGNPGLLAPGRLSKFAASGIGAASDVFNTSSEGAKQIDGGLIPPGGVVTTTKAGSTTSTLAAPVTTAPPPVAPAPTAAPVAVAPPASVCTPDARIVSPAANQSATFRKSRTARITLSVASTCKGTLSLTLSALGLRLTSPGPSQGSIRAGVWTISDYDPTAPAPSLSLTASSSTRGTKVLTIKLAQAGDTNLNDNVRTLSLKVT